MYSIWSTRELAFLGHLYCGGFNIYCYQCPYGNEIIIFCKRWAEKSRLVNENTYHKFSRGKGKRQMKFRLSINYDPKDGHKEAEGGWRGCFCQEIYLLWWWQQEGIFENVTSILYWTLFNMIGCYVTWQITIGSTNMCIEYDRSIYRHKEHHALAWCLFVLF